ncbi:unnamed protein product [Miscanthus lutarioriparius]|uniref:Uncharacterized protein n=1 Tax=Miscanthus lutarioriparius TaxID=422564 RepID=A0A811NXF9_9POAL|nr:unnamed protein product [Miscanthus lutarioriparius]
MSSTLQLRTNGDHDGAVSIGISPSEAMVAEVGSDNSKQLQRWLCASGLATLVMDAGTAFYRPPHGVVFEQHRFAYYATLAGIFAAGLAEVGTACWLDSSGQQQRGRARGRAFRVSVVCASAVPLVAIIALGGVVMKG